MLLQRHGVVVLSILRGKEQCDGMLSGFLRQFLDSFTLIIQFGRILLFELLPTDRIVSEPFAQPSARREILEPFADPRFRLFEPAWPDAVNEHAPAIGRGRLVVNAL